jgi:septum formation protein
MICFWLKLHQQWLKLNKKILVLGSTSTFRAQLLSRLLLPYITVRPETDETALPNETPAHTALRLAIEKAANVTASVAKNLPEALIIGADQVADFAGVHIGKPHTREAARAQLHSFRGQEVVFHSAMALQNSATGNVQSCVIPTTVRYRNVSDAAIEAYLDREDALNCAGSAKSEGLGIALMTHMTSDDPSALIGLPLIALVTMLEAEGMAVLA